MKFLRKVTFDDIEIAEIYEINKIEFVVEFDKEEGVVNVYNNENNYLNSIQSGILIGYIGSEYCNYSEYYSLIKAEKIIKEFLNGN